MSKRPRLIGIDEAENSANVAVSVFRTEFEGKVADLKQDLKEQRGLSFNIIIGCIVALFFVIGTIVWDSRSQMSQYQDKYLETQKELSVTQTQNATLSKEIDRLGQRVDDLQKIMLELKIR
jgi:uncharacterized protein YlxW (UPF0749 family)